MAPRPPNLEPGWPQTAQLGAQITAYIYRLKPSPFFPRSGAAPALPCGLMVAIGGAPDGPPGGLRQ
eukprot:2030832-Karenia_brevis.AAC.1